VTTGAIRFPREMSEQDALMWNVDSEPMLRSTTAAVTLLEAAPDPGLLRFRLEQAAAEIPRLRQRVVVLPRFISRPNWVRDPDFDLDYHLRRVRAPGDGSLESVFELAATLAMGSFDRSRPLWEFTVVEGLEAGRAALIQKLHHAVTDGIAGMLLMDRVYDREPGRAAPDASSRALPDEPEPDTLGLIAEAFRRRLRERPRRLRQQATRLLEAARTPLQSTRDTVRDALELAPSLVPPREPLSPIARARSSRYRFHGVCIDLESFRRAGRAHGCTINDAFLTAMTGALDRYHRLHGARADELRAMVPVNLRGPGLKDAATSGNRVALARVAMPVAERDPRKRMIEIHTRLRRELKRPNEAVADLLAGFGNRMPAALRRPLFRSFSQGNDFVASCVPGLPAPLYMAGARVAGFYMFGPTAGSALNATFFSYGSQASIALNVDPAAIPDHELLRRCTAEGLDEVGKLG
jgi:WS/DGAT/MGAT family acyltransferase